MSFEGAFLLLLSLIVVLPLLFWLPRLVNWLAGRKLVPLWLPFVIAPGALVAGSLYLDTAGIVTPVKVVDKREIISLGRNGSWSRELSAHIEYQPPGEIIPTPLTLGCDAATFDKLRIGQTVEVRVLNIGQHFKFARLKDRSTFSLVAGLVPHSPRGPWRQATAVVHDIRHVTRYTYRRLRSDDELRWPFDIVQLNFTPEGRAGAVTAVDVIEAASMPNLANGDSVQITWPEDDPRSAKILGARPGAPWKNWFYNFGRDLVVITSFAAFLILIGFIRRRRKKARKPLT